MYNFFVIISSFIVRSLIAFRCNFPKFQYFNFFIFWKHFAILMWRGFHFASLLPNEHISLFRWNPLICNKKCMMCDCTEIDCQFLLIKQVFIDWYHVFVFAFQNICGHLHRDRRRQRNSINKLQFFSQNFRRSCIYIFRKMSEQISQRNAILIIFSSIIMCG